MKRRNCPEGFTQFLFSTIINPATCFGQSSSPLLVVALGVIIVKAVQTSWFLFMILPRLLSRWMETHIGNTRKRIDFEKSNHFHLPLVALKHSARSVTWLLSLELVFNRVVTPMCIIRQRDTNNTYLPTYRLQCEYANRLPWGWLWVVLW